METFLIELPPQAPAKGRIRMVISSKMVHMELDEEGMKAELDLNMPMAQAIGAAVGNRHKRPSQKGSMAQILQSAPEIMKEYKKGQLSRIEVEVLFGLMIN